VTVDLWAWAAWGAMAAVTVAGAVGVLAARETMRLVVGLGTFLLGMAGLYLYYAMPLLAASQVFLYVGGVLVLFLFAIMALRRPDLAGDRRGGSVMPVAVCAGLFAVMVAALWEMGGAAGFAPVATAGSEVTGDLLLSGLLPQFEILGVLLLAGLAVALAITDGGGER
jgi:NADH:ubiquinone oxidoreductase subunit 6 (subunit J)